MNAIAIYAQESRTEMLKALRTPEYAFPTFVFPIAFFALFGLALSSGVDGARYLMATYGVFATIGPALFGFGTGLAHEREQGMLALKRISPMPDMAYPVAKLATATAMGSLTLMGIYMLAVLVGGVQVPAEAWIAMIAVHLLSILPFSLLGLVLGYTLRAQGAIAIANILFFLCNIGGGLWMPIHVLPDWMERMAVVLPSFHLGELALIAAGFARPQPWTAHLLALVAMTVVLALLVRVAARRSSV